MFLAAERDGKANAIFLLEIIFFLYETVIPKYTTRFRARPYIPAIVITNIYYNYSRQEIK